MSNGFFEGFIPKAATNPPKKKVSQKAGIGGSAGATQPKPRGFLGTAVATVQPTQLPAGKPDPTLSQHGYVGSAAEFDHRVGAVRDSYKKIKGVEPPAGLAFDVARSSVPPDQFDRMFAPLGLTKTAARVAGIGGQVGAYYNPTPAGVPRLEAITPEQKAALQDPEHRAQLSFMNAQLGGSPGKDFLHALKIGELATTQGIQGLAYSPYGVYLISKAAALDTQDYWVNRKPGTRTEKLGKQMAKGFVQDFRHPEERPGFLFLDLLGIVTLGGGGVARASAVGRAASEGAGIGGIVKTAIRRPEPGTYTFQVGSGEGTTLTPQIARLEKQVAAKTKQLARTEQPNLVGLRQKELARLKSAHSIAVRKANYAVRQSSEQPTDWGAVAESTPYFSADKLLSENSTYRAAQNVVYSWLEKRVNARQAVDRVPAVAHDSALFAAMKKLFDDHLSTEARLGREAAAARRVEQASQLAILAVLRKAAGYSVVSSNAFARIAARARELVLPDRARFGLTRGEHKAIQVLAVGEPITAWENLHNAVIRDSAMWAKELNIPEQLLVKNHERQLADLKLAQRILEDPSKQSERFIKAATLAKEVSDEMTRIKIEEFGLNPRTAEARIRAQAAVVRTGKPKAEASTSQIVRGYRGGGISKRPVLYIAHDEKLAQAFARKNGDVQMVESRVSNALHIDTPAQNAEWLRHGGSEAKAAAWAKSQGYDAVVRSEQAIPGHGAQGARAGETILLYPERASVVKSGQNVAIPTTSEFAKEPTRPFGDLPQGFYTPFISARDTKMTPSGASPFAARQGPYGIPLPGDIPEIQHVFTGDSIMAGDFRIDATHLIGNAYGRTVRAATIWNNYKQLLAASRKKPPMKGTVEEQTMVPMREMRAVSDALRMRLQKIDEGDFTATDAEHLGDDAQAIIRELFPENAPIDQVRWVDGRLKENLVGGLSAQTTGPGAVLYTMNEAFRLPILFLRPAYILNLLGNVGMAVIHQGPMMGPNIIRALYAHKLFGERNVSWIDTMMGNSRSRSYVNPDIRGAAKVFTRGSQKIAEGWNMVADLHFRRSAFIYEARRKGYETQADMDRLRTSADLAVVKDRMEITRRANKGMVEFDNLTRFEKQWMRNLIFVYPWVSRSAIWSVRTIMEHPLKTDALAHLGDEAQYQNEPLMKAPQWFKQSGYFPVSWGADGNPKVVSAQTINTFSTLSELTHPFTGLYSGDVTTTPLADLLGPVPLLGLHALTGRDRYGNEYKGGRILGALKEQGQQLPQISAFRRGQRQPAPPGTAPKNRPTFVPGLWDTYGPLIGSVLWPREADLGKLQYDYWREQKPTVRVEQQVQVVRAVAKVQSKILEQPIPGDVKDGLDLLANRMRVQAKWAEDHGRTPGSREKRGLDINVLKQLGRITPEQEKKLREQLLAAKSDKEFARFGSMLDKQYLGGNALEAWHSDVNTVASFEKTYGLDYGRRYLAVQKEQDRLVAAAMALPSATGEQGVAFAKLATFEQAQDKSFNGHPSPIREMWNRTSPAQRQEILAKKAGQPWEFLSTFDKELLGRKPSSDAAGGWEKFTELRQQAKDNLPPGHKHFPPGYLDTLAKYTDRYYAKGFFKDYLVSKEPLVQRLLLGGFQPAKMEAPLERSPNADLWRQMLAPAARYAQLLRNPDYPKTKIRDLWKQYVQSSLLPWARSHPAMRKELQMYPPNFLYSLLS